MKKQLALAVIVLSISGINSFGDPAPIVPPSSGARHGCDVHKYYPKELVRACVQGSVGISFRIGVTGATKDWVITRSSGNSQLDEATRVCIADWHYNPATQDGKPVEVPWAARMNWSLSPEECPGGPNPFDGAKVVPATPTGERHVCGKVTDSGELAAAAGGHVTIQLEYIIGIDGRATHITVTRSSGSATLDDAARLCIQNWTWKPAMEDGVPFNQLERTSVDYPPHLNHPI